MGTVQRLELNGGQVENNGNEWRLILPSVVKGYADAQIYDYGRLPYRRRTFPWTPGCRMHLHARFSHVASELLGTAGFGFWNAPFIDPLLKQPSLPQAAWFFFASAPNDLPFADTGPGCGWFAATMDAATPQALAWAPMTPLVLLLNHIAGVRRRLWPAVQQSLGISFAPLDLDMQAWHRYELLWLADGCRFQVDGADYLVTKHSPRGPLGFVCWIDNQYLVATANGRFRWGTLPIAHPQWMELSNLTLEFANQL